MLYGPHFCLSNFIILDTSRTQPLCLFALGFSPKVYPAHVQQEQSLPTTGGGWWINTPAPFPLGWIPQRLMFETVSPSPQKKYIPAAHSGNLLAKHTFLGYFLFLASLTPSLACPGITFQINYLPWNHCLDSSMETQLKAGFSSNVQPLGATRVCVKRPAQTGCYLEKGEVSQRQMDLAREHQAYFENARRGDAGVLYYKLEPSTNL